MFCRLRIYFSLLGRVLNTFIAKKLCVLHVSNDGVTLMTPKSVLPNWAFSWGNEDSAKKFDCKTHLSLSDIGKKISTGFKFSFSSLIKMFSLCLMRSMGGSSVRNVTSWKGFLQLLHVFKFGWNEMFFLGPFFFLDEGRFRVDFRSVELNESCFGNKSLKKLNFLDFFE